MLTIVRTSEVRPSARIAVTGKGIAVIVTTENVVRSIPCTSIAEAKLRLMSERNRLARVR